MLQTHNSLQSKLDQTIAIEGSQRSIDLILSNEFYEHLELQRFVIISKKDPSRHAHGRYFLTFATPHAAEKTFDTLMAIQNSESPEGRRALSKLNYGKEEQEVVKNATTKPLWDCDLPLIEAFRKSQSAMTADVTKRVAQAKEMTEKDSIVELNLGFVAEDMEKETEKLREAKEESSLTTRKAEESGTMVHTIKERIDTLFSGIEDVRLDLATEALGATDVLGAKDAAGAKDSLGGAGI